MNLKLVFKVSAAILAINCIMALFLTTNFFEMAAFEVTPSLVTFGQFVGVTFLAMSLIAWKTPDLVIDAIPGFGQVYAITQGMWAVIIIYHIAIGAAGGPTAIANAGISVFSVYCSFFIVENN